MPKQSKKLIEQDIKRQLKDQQKIGKYYDDLVNEYMYKFVNGNGKEQEKPNESIANLIKVEQIMLKIINDLGIIQPLAPLPSSPEEPDKENGEERDLL